MSWRDKAVIIPHDEPADAAPLVTALVGAGATYYSSRYAVLDSRGRVHAYQEPLADATTCGEAVPPNSPDTRRAHAEQRPVPVGLVVLRRELGLSSGLCELSTAQAVLGLVRHTVVSRLRPRFALDVLKRALSGAVGVATLRELDADVSRLLDRLDHLPSPMRVC